MGTSSIGMLGLQGVLRVLGLLGGLQVLGVPGVLGMQEVLLGVLELLGGSRRTRGLGEVR